MNGKNECPFHPCTVFKQGNEPKVPHGAKPVPKPTTLRSLKSSFNFVTSYQMNPLTKFRVIVKILEVKPSSPLPILVEENV